LSKAGKSQILYVLLTGPRDPRYGSEKIPIGCPIFNTTIYIYLMKIANKWKMTKLERFLYQVPFDTFRVDQLTVEPSIVPISEFPRISKCFSSEIS
jgi:hypothetical protein